MAAEFNGSCAVLYLQYKDVKVVPYTPYSMLGLLEHGHHPGQCPQLQHCQTAASILHTPCKLIDAACTPAQPLYCSAHVGALPALPKAQCRLTLVVAGLARQLCCFSCSQHLPACATDKAVKEDGDSDKRGWFANLLSGPGSTVALAFLCNKALLPVRVPITVGLTPAVAR